MQIADGELITLRSMEFEDIPFFLGVRNACREFLHNNAKFSLKQCVKWWDTYNPMFYIIEHDGTPVGYVRISNWDHVNKHVYVGVDIHPDHRRLGYAQETYRSMLNYLFILCHMNKVALEVLSTNQAALALYRKVGFKTDGVKRAELRRDGQFVDSVIMSILSSEWKT
ncbi:MAG: GNAT family N-acetyltransferase [Candidatus Thorarchaeota archaeon]|jgi:RimJ/RimL family protein N-acetyltransferase